MMDNNLHNLMTQLVQENKSLWRIREAYKKDAEGNDASVAFWERMEADKQAHVNELKELIKNSL